MESLSDELAIRLMDEAIEIAKSNPRAPFGCILFDVSLNQTVARGVNNSKENPLLHGEIVAINSYAETGHDRWSDLALITTAEPCCMCQGAILWSGIEQVVYGSSIATLKQQGWRQIDIASARLAQLSWRMDLGIRQGILEAECDALFREAMQVKDSQDRTNSERK
ncbi:MAG: nucleoside deaminase [Aureliella sp.]